LRLDRPRASTGEAPLVFEVIGRLALGGAVTQAVTLAGLLGAPFRAVLVTGTSGGEEREMTELVEGLRVRPWRVAGMRRELGPHDWRALLAMVRLIRRERPVLVHTHAAKGGTIGRLAAFLAVGARPRVVVHTFHGHVLTGYFSARTSRIFTLIERALGRVSTALVAVAPEVRDDLLARGVGKPEQWHVIPVGLELEAFQVPEPERVRARDTLRFELGIDPEVVVITAIARLAEVKRLDRLLRIAARCADLPHMRFLIVGAGPLDRALRAQADALGLGERVIWTGYRTDVDAVCFASDLVTLTSDNEGTPTSAIEAHAAGLPVLAMKVGGVAEVVRDGETGLLVDAGDEAAFEARLRELIADPARRHELGERGRAHVFARFSRDRMLSDTRALYEELLQR
jgi:glycosyltransferase involved in cell wall biosynthesis